MGAGTSGAIEQLAQKSGVDAKLLEKLMGAKAPSARGVWEGIKGIGGFGEEGLLLPEGKGGTTAIDKITQILSLLEMQKGR